MNSFIAALQFLTIFPWPKRAHRSGDETGRSATFFPVVGLLLGTILAVVNFVLEPLLASGLLSVLLVALLALLTRGLHLDGLGDTFDGLGAGGDRGHVLEVMDDSHIGAFGLIAIVLVLFIKIHAIESMEIGRWRSLLIAPVMGRWAMVLLGYRSRTATSGLGSAFIDQLATRQLFFATIVTLLSAVAALRGTGIVLMLWVAVFALLCKWYFHRRLGGVTGDAFGAAGELSEASVLVLLAVAAR